MDETLIENLKREKLEEMEFDKIDEILPSLLQQNLITAMEYRIIASCTRLLEKQAAVHNIIMSKTEEEAAHLTKVFGTLTCPADELSKTSKTSDCEDEQENNFLQDKLNALLIDTVLACLFEYFPLDDIKHFRLVCLKWNSVAEASLIKRSAIHFRADGLTPKTFLKISTYLPFSSFKFSDVDYAMCVDHIENFFDKWGQNIKEVKLVALEEGPHDAIYDVTPWIAKTSQLCSLKIKCEQETLFSISKDQLATIKTVFLENCRILTNDERVSFLPLSNVSLINVSFQRLGDIEVLQDFCYNETFDFSQVANLALNNAKLDMASQIFNINQLNLCYVTLRNWSQATGDVNVLRLTGCNLTERNDLKITSMIIFYDSDVNLSALPRTLEKLSLQEEVNIVSREPFQLPNLKYLSFEAETEFPFLLANCPNLTEVEISNNTYRNVRTLNLHGIPSSVKKLRIEGRVELRNGDQILEIDTLLLKTTCNDIRHILTRIKPKILVISCSEYNSSGIIEIILANTQIETIVVAIDQKDEYFEYFPFEGSTFSSHVDRKSDYYKFENQVGHAIERKEYEEFTAIAWIAIYDFIDFSKLNF